jgi:hypothetical protein
MSNNMNLANPLQIRDFHIKFNNINQTRDYTIENIQELEEIIRVYGRKIIYSITFYFYDNIHQYHNLTFQNTGYDDKFVTEFFHYYNTNYHRIELNRDQQYNDFVAVMNILNSKQILQSRFIPYIINPFHQPQMT